MKSILIIDDNKVNLATARMVLRDEYKIIPVTSGVQALIYLEKNDCDIILLDINMPEMDGFEVIEKIKSEEIYKDIPVVFLTGEDDPEVKKKGLEKGALEFITKPLVKDNVFECVNRLLGGE